MEKVAGVYTITNTGNGKVYVGSSVNVPERLRRHKTNLLNNRHCNSFLQAAFNTCGQDSFAFELVEVCGPRELLVHEQRWLDSSQASDRRFGYNLLPFAGNRLGSTHSEETKAKISKAGRGLKRSQETRERISRAAKGRVITDEARLKMSIAAKSRLVDPTKHSRYGCVVSEETRIKISESLRRRAERSEYVWYGRERLP